MVAVTLLTMSAWNDALPGRIGHHDTMTHHNAPDQLINQSDKKCKCLCQTPCF